MRETLEKTLNVLLVLAALAVAGTLVHREFFTASAAQAAPVGPQFVKEWRTFLPVGRLVGDSAAPVTIVEFVDMQCPFCRRFNETLTRAMEKHEGKIGYVFIHLPIPSHPFAQPAARAVECAGAQGSFKPFVNAVFAQQDSIGKKTWPAFAMAARVADTARFARCARDTTALAMVDAGVALAGEQGIRATPTILVNGWKYNGALSDAQLERAIARLLDGKDPQ